jgi:hypothetical protein
VKILKFWRTELPHAQNKQRDENECLLGIDNGRVLYEKLSNK